MYIMASNRGRVDPFPSHPYNKGKPPPVAHGEMTLADIAFSLFDDSTKKLLLGSTTLPQQATMGGGGGGTVVMDIFEAVISKVRLEVGGGDIREQDIINSVFTGIQATIVGWLGEAKKLQAGDDQQKFDGLQIDNKEKLKAVLNKLSVGQLDQRLTYYGSEQFKSHLRISTTNVTKYQKALENLFNQLGFKLIITQSISCV